MGGMRGWEGVWADAPVNVVFVIYARYLLERRLGVEDVGILSNFKHFQSQLAIHNI